MTSPTSDLYHHWLTTISHMTSPTSDLYRHWLIRTSPMSRPISNDLTYSPMSPPISNDLTYILRTPPSLDLLVIVMFLFPVLRCFQRCALPFLWPLLLQVTLPPLTFLWATCFVWCSVRRAVPHGHVGLNSESILEAFQAEIRKWNFVLRVLEPPHLCRIPLWHAIGTS